MALLERDGHSIYYQVIDKVLPQDTLFIHGNLASHQWWHPSLEFLKSVHESRDPQGRAILVDWRGCGKSSAPHSQKDMSVECLAQDHLEVLSRLQVEKAHVVGHSTGGLVALIAMSIKSDAFAKALLLDSVGARGVSFDDSMDKAFNQMAQDKELAGAVVGGTIANNDPSSEFYQQVVKENAFTGAKNIGLKLLNNLKDLDSRKRIEELKHKVLVLHGENDGVLPIEDSRKLSDLLENSTFEVIAGHGHCWNVEDPQAFARKVNEFLFSTDTH